MTVLQGHFCCSKLTHKDKNISKLKEGDFGLLFFIQVIYFFKVDFVYRHIHVSCLYLKFLSRCMQKRIHAQREHLTTNTELKQIKSKGKTHFPYPQTCAGFYHVSSLADLFLYMEILKLLFSSMTWEPTKFSFLIFSLQTLL